MVSSAQYELDFSWEGLRLAGTLHLPDRSSPHPGVLMMQGSGPTDRDNDAYFPQIRSAFLDRGIAVYSFDKPGVGGSTGNWRDHALEGRADQSAAALEAISRHPKIDSGRIGIWGHSQGGWVAQIVASRLPGLAFAICNSGPSIGVEEQDLYGCEHTMRAHGDNQPEIEKALALTRALHREARQRTDYATIDKELLEPARSEAWYGYLTVEDEADWAFLGRLVAEDYDPVTALRRIHCPYLAVYGGDDLLVPAWESARASGEAISQAGNRDATVVVFPGGNHRIQRSDSGEFAIGYLDLIGGWTALRVMERSD